MSRKLKDIYRARLLEESLKTSLEEEPRSVRASLLDSKVGRTLLETQLRETAIRHLREYRLEEKRRRRVAASSPPPLCLKTSRRPLVEEEEQILISKECSDGESEEVHFVLSILIWPKN